MKTSESSLKPSNSNPQNREKLAKRSFLPAKDDTKPILQDPILRSPSRQRKPCCDNLPFLLLERQTPNPKSLEKTYRHCSRFCWGFCLFSSEWFLGRNHGAFGGNTSEEGFSRKRKRRRGGLRNFAQFWNDPSRNHAS